MKAQLLPTDSPWTFQESAAKSVLSSSLPHAACAKFPTWLRMHWIAGTFTLFSVFPICMQAQETSWSRGKGSVCVCLRGYKGPASERPEGWAGTCPGEQPVPAGASCSCVIHNLKSEQQLILVLSPASNMSQPLQQPLHAWSALDKTPWSGCCLHGSRLLPCRSSSESFQSPEVFWLPTPLITIMSCHRSFHLTDDFQV